MPYSLGCFSFSADADLTTLAAKGLLRESATDFRKLDATDYLPQLRNDDLNFARQVKSEHGNMDADDLLEYIYVNFPFYASKGKTLEDVPSKTGTHTIETSEPITGDTILFTIGYEGISLEEYLVRLLNKDVQVLVDVRWNPLSMKYGFRKRQLQRCCESLGIAYIHLGELGIHPEQRKDLRTQTDYDKLFASYRTENLSKTVKAQNYILDLLKKKKRIALTCFEANICHCHRKELAEAIEKLSGFLITTVHI